MPDLPTVCVIGAGSSGIAAAKALHERGIPFDCFEKSDRVGGNWVFGNSNGMSSAYRSLHINTSRERMEYSDFPMPKSLSRTSRTTRRSRSTSTTTSTTSACATGSAFETGVEHAARAATTASGTVDARRRARRAPTTRVLVANGHHWDPRWPEPAFPGRRSTASRCTRTTTSTPRSCRGKRVRRRSGWATARWTSPSRRRYVARDTSTSPPAAARYIIPKYLFGRPLDQIGGNSLTARSRSRVRQRDPPAR